MNPEPSIQAQISEARNALFALNGVPGERTKRSLIRHRIRVLLEKAYGAGARSIALERAEQEDPEAVRISGCLYSEVQHAWVKIQPRDDA